MNAIALRIGVRYCGGCTPRYDRVATVEYIRRNLPHGVELVRREDDSGMVLIVAGCKTACADRTGLEGKVVQELTSETDAITFIEYIRRNRNSWASVPTGNDLEA